MMIGPSQLTGKPIPAGSVADHARDKPRHGLQRLERGALRQLFRNDAVTAKHVDEINPFNAGIGAIVAVPLTLAAQYAVVVPERGAQFGLRGDLIGHLYTAIPRV